MLINEHPFGSMGAIRRNPESPDPSLLGNTLLDTKMGTLSAKHSFPFARLPSTDKLMLLGTFYQENRCCIHSPMGHVDNDAGAVGDFAMFDTRHRQQSLACAAKPGPPRRTKNPARRKMLELFSDLPQYLQRERHGPMPTYYFDLHTPREVVRDLVGSELACEASAREHAAGVARELMQHREGQTRSWRLDVRDGEGRRVFKLMLVTVDESLARFRPELRSSLENMCANNASLCDTIRTVKRSLHQIKGTMARVDRLPYLTTI
jgi:hypothetical protein